MGPAQRRLRHCQRNCICYWQKSKQWRLTRVRCCGLSSVLWPQVGQRQPNGKYNRTSWWIHRPYNTARHHQLMSLQHVPIPLAEYCCNRTNNNRVCCKRTYLPLCLSYARTIHKFQGLSAGPVDEGKIPNMFACIICDPDMRHVEGSALGLFYTALSRATTLGNEDGSESAIYFTGTAYDEARIRNIGRMKNT